MSISLKTGKCTCKTWLSLNSNFRTAVINTSILCKRHKSSTDVIPQNPDGSYDRSQPIQYSTSKAAEWKAYYGRYGGGEPGPHLEESKASQIVIPLSIAVLFIYLNIREGNDIDEELDMPLGKRILGLQEWQILKEKEARMKDGEKVTEDLDWELREIEALKKKYKYI